MKPRIAIVLIAALILRLLFITSHGFKYDIDAYSNWATILATHGPLAMYGPLPSPPVDYPPGYLYVLWVLGLASHAFHASVLGMRVLLKVVPIVADLFVVWFSYTAATRLANERAALVLAAVVAFAPPLWLDSAFWGQSDSVPTALLYAAIFALASGTSIAALPLLAIAIVTKPQGLALVPAMLVLCRRTREAARGFALGCVASLGLTYAATLPFTTARSALAVFAFLFGTYANGVAVAPYTTNGAFNLYTLVTTYHQDDSTTVAGVSIRIFAIALVAAIVLIIAFAFARSLRNDSSERNRLAQTLGASSLSLLAFFLFATRIHERYLLPAIALGAPLAVEDRPTAIALAWLALTFTINCAYSFKGYYTPSHPLPIALLERALALGNIAAFIVLWRRQSRRLTSS